MPNESYKAKQRLCSKFRRELKKRATNAEKCMREHLKNCGIRFLFQKGFFVKEGTFYITDFLFT